MKTCLARRAFLLTAPAFALAGCGGDLLGPPPAGQIYVLDAGAPAPMNGAKVNWALAVVRPDAIGGLDSDRIALIQSDATMDYYANASYPDLLPALVQTALISRFEAGGRIDQVSREQDALHSDYDLFVIIKNFEAHYSAKDAVPSVQVTLDVRLATAHGRKILGSFIAAQTGQATANSAGAVAQALGQALGQAAQAVVNWSLAQPLPATSPQP